MEQLKLWDDGPALEEFTAVMKFSRPSFISDEVWFEALDSPHIDTLPLSNLAFEAFGEPKLIKVTVSRLEGE